MVAVSASVNLPLHHKVHKFSSGTGSPRWSRKKGRKTVVCVCVCPGEHGSAGSSMVSQVNLLSQFLLGFPGEPGSAGSTSAFQANVAQPVPPLFSR